MIAIASPNIAFIKYWGKVPALRDEDRNLATNPSLSMTLARAQTRTEVRAGGQGLRVSLNGQAANALDQEKIRRHLERITTFLGQEFPGFEVVSENNFPQGTGLASSASAFAALTLAALAALAGKEKAEILRQTQAAALGALARRGSGSACRSLIGGFARWEGASAVPFAKTWALRDTIVIFSRQPKAVSSSEGHEAAQRSPLFEERLENLPERLRQVEAAIEARDLMRLGPCLEREALELHAVVESSLPPIQYQSPETRIFLRELQTLNARDFFFTLDAGPNVHLISERPIRDEIEELLRRLNLVAEIWEDWTGNGPVILSSR